MTELIRKIVASYLFNRVLDTPPHQIEDLKVSKYLRMDQVKSMEDSLYNTPSNFLKPVFHKFYFVHS